MRPILRNLLECALVSLCSMIVMATIHPDLLLFAQIRFTAGHDIQIPFQAAFFHAGYFLNDGVQIYNRFDQVNHAYLHLSTGYHSFAAILEGYLFSSFEALVARPGAAFQQFHSIAFFTICTLVRTAGGIALLNLYRLSGPARFLALLAMNSLLAQQTYVGLVAGFLYSLAPLVLCFIVRLLRRVNLANLLWLLVVLGFAFAQAPLIALGYFYLPIHLFLVGAILTTLFWVWLDRRRRTAAQPEPPGPPAARGRAERLLLAAGLALALVVIAANVSYLPLLTGTFSLQAAGKLGDDNRFDNVLDPLDFIEQRGSGPPVSEAFAGWVDFAHNAWWSSWPLIGAACLALSLIGAICGRDRERWLYALGFALALLVQVRRDYVSLGLPAHYITSLTNPFAFLIRNSHMSTFLMGYFLVPLIAFGVDALRRHGEEARPFPGRPAALLSVVLLLVASGACLATLTAESAYLTAGVFLATGAGLAVSALRPTATALIGVLPFLLLVADLYGYRIWLDRADYTRDQIQPREFSGLVHSAAVEPNPIVLDYANPATRHFPLYARNRPDPVAPTTDPEFPTDFAVYFIRQVYMGRFFETVFTSRHLNPLFIYELRHKRYAAVPDDPALAALIEREDRLFSFRPLAVGAEQVAPKSLIEAGAEGWAVSLAGPYDGWMPRAIESALPATPPAVERPEPRTLTFEFDFAAAVERPRGDLVEYAFALPEDFPPYLASTVFSADALRLRAFLGETELAPAQGRLIRPFTFDVRNVASEALVVALPSGKAPEQPIGLRVRLDPLVTAVHTGSDDLVSLEITAPADGWLVWQNPLDSGWSASVDGRSVAIRAANEIAMAVPVHAGTNEVEFRYAADGLFRLCRWLVQVMLVALPLLGLVVIAAALSLSAPPARGSTGAEPAR